MATDTIIVPEAKNTESHVASTLHPDTLFHFMSQIDWLLDALKNRMLSARYCCENSEPFHIEGLKEMAFPMKCFCDISLHKMDDHIEWYGPYGIAFSKMWGMERGIQPVQYINSESPLCKELAEALGSTLSAEQSEPGSVREKLESFSLLQLMYWKPYQGRERKRLSGEYMVKCFCDESEWRFIPDLHDLNMPMVIRDDNDLIGKHLKEYSDAINGKEQASLTFDYEDIKHIIINDLSDYGVLEEAINNWNIDSLSRRTLLSKVLIWNNLRGDA